MIHERTFREALSHFPSGVTILTLSGQGGCPRGMTVSAFSSLSLQPALVLACIDRRAGCHDKLRPDVPFGISILSSDQADLARRFAAAAPDRFEGVRYRVGETGVPLIEGACAQIECRVDRQHMGGDHSIVVGAVAQAHVSGGAPLVYAQRLFHSLTPQQGPDGPRHLPA